MWSCSRRCLKQLEKCKTMKQIKQVHAQTITCGLEQNSFALSRLLHFCSNPNHGNLNYALKLFHHIQNPTICIYNTIIKALLLKGEVTDIFYIYSIMLQHNMYPDAYTLPYLLKASVKLQSLCLGELVHGCCLKLGYGFKTVVGNCLISMYCGFGDVGAARCVFNEILSPCVVSWTLMINGYAKVGDVDNARLFFDEAPRKDLGVWGAMISGYVQNNSFKECLYMFRLMQETDLVPDEGIFLSILSACAQLGALDSGIWIHRYLDRLRSPLSVRLCTGLIDMYAKCGNLELAKRVFDGMSHRDGVCWNVMIFGLAVHGDGKGALKLFQEMEEAGFRPDDITFMAVLSACNHSGMAYEGLGVLDRMCNVYNIEPKSEHYGCIVELFGRASLLEEAEEIIQRMPSSASSSEEAVAWRALLSACYAQAQGQAQRAEVAAEKLIQLELHSGAYVLLSNMYLAAGKHDDAKRMRKMMRMRGVDKDPGCSSIKIDGMIHEFIAGEKTHPRIEDVKTVLLKMSKQLGLGGCNQHLVSC